MAANPLTNRIYVAEPATNSLAVIDGSNNSFAVVPTGYALEVAIDELRNKIYLLSAGDTITVIDGETNRTSSISTLGSSANSLALDVLTNQVYAANLYNNNVSVLNGPAGVPLASLDELARAPNAGK
jgi:DNA-binding beta-propeller fold protein YncE